MGISIGNNTIDSITLGNSDVKVYLGNVLVYEAQSYDPVLENNTWEQIAQACADGDSILTTWLGQTKSGTWGNMNTSFRMVDNYVGRYTFADNSNNHAVFEMVNVTSNTSYYSSTMPSGRYGWGDCSIYNVYNGNWLNNLDNNIRDVLKTTNVKSIKNYDTNGYSYQCKIFPASVIEMAGVNSSINYFNSDQSKYVNETNGGQFAYYAGLTQNNSMLIKKCINNNVNGRYWLRSPNDSSSGYSWYVNDSGVMTNEMVNSIACFGSLCFAL